MSPRRCDRFKGMSGCSAVASKFTQKKRYFLENIKGPNERATSFLKREGCTRNGEKRDGEKLRKETHSLAIGKCEISKALFFLFVTKLGAGINEIKFECWAFFMVSFYCVCLI